MPTLYPVHYPMIPPNSHSGTPVTPTKHTHKSDVVSTKSPRGTIPSSDAAEYEDVIPFPDLDQFLPALDEKIPRRRPLALHLEALTNADYYTVGDVVKLTKEELKHDFGFTQGSAQFLLERSNKEVRRVIAERKKLHVSFTK
ncbi:hypothetical protein AAF712_014465 [Marasmius tenuissimus]|uniref:Uncharacterized protein n=1 Tax=Marasmius tenuissimus TaxID=585030 RepID=A0ABR2ZC03_9AGAR